MEITHHINLGLDEFVLINSFPFLEASSITSDIIPTERETNESLTLKRYLIDIIRLLFRIKFINILLSRLSYTYSAF